MNKIFALVFCFGMITGCSAQSEPVAGIWKRLPVVGPDHRAQIRTSYVFTEQPLTEPTIFTALEDNTEGYSIVCCVQVSNTKPLDVKAVVLQYKNDPVFTGAISSVKGARFMYEAHPVDKKYWTPEPATLARTDQDPADVSPYSAPVISGMLPKKDLNRDFEVGGKKIHLHNTRDKAKSTITYHFKIDNRPINFSEFEPHAH
jgi:hypothetical protein